MCQPCSGYRGEHQLRVSRRALLHLLVLNPVCLPVLNPVCLLVLNPLLSLCLQHIHRVFSGSEQLPCLPVKKESTKSMGLPLHNKCKITYPVFLCSAINQKA